MRLVIFTSSSLRHKAFAKRVCQSKDIEVLQIFYESGNQLQKLVNERNNNSIQLNHLLARDQCEKDVFGLFLKYTYDNSNLEKYIDRGWFSSSDCLNKLDKINPDLILVFGTSIIKGEIINRFNKKILNVHLGLSPYYRGSGTNYFPFVNNEPEYCGATYMYLDAGVDTGQIIHQTRPQIFSTDSFHQLSNRFLIKVFDDYVRIVENFDKIQELEPSKAFSSNNNRHLYKKKDFSDESILKLQNNFANGMLAYYLDKKNLRDGNVPIMINPILI